MNKVTDILQEVKDAICNDYCKYPEKCLAEIKDPDEAEQYCLDHYCADCPLGRL